MKEGCGDLSTSRLNRNGTKNYRHGHARYDRLKQDMYYSAPDAQRLNTYAKAGKKDKCRSTERCRNIQLSPRLVGAAYDVSITGTCEDMNENVVRV